MEVQKRAVRRDRKGRTGFPMSVFRCASFTTSWLHQSDKHEWLFLSDLNAREKDNRVGSECVRWTISQKETRQKEHSA